MNSKSDYRVIDSLSDTTTIPSDFNGLSSPMRRGYGSAQSSPVVHRGQSHLWHNIQDNDMITGVRRRPIEGIHSKDAKWGIKSTSTSIWMGITASLVALFYLIILHYSSHPSHEIVGPFLPGGEIYVHHEHEEKNMVTSKITSSPSKEDADAIDEVKQDEVSEGHQKLSGWLDNINDWLGYINIRDNNQSLEGIHPSRLHALRSSSHPNRRFQLSDDWIESKLTQPLRPLPPPAIGWRSAFPPPAVRRSIKSESLYPGIAAIATPSYSLSDVAEWRPFSEEISVVIIASSSDWFLLPIALSSVYEQTVLPKETIIILSNSAEYLDYSPYSHAIPFVDSRSDQPQSAGDALRRVLMDDMEKRPSDSIFDENDSDNPYLLDDICQMLTKLPTTQALIHAIPNVTVYTTMKEEFAAVNRRVGIQNASGTIVSLFDADDAMHPRRIESLHSTMMIHPDVDIILHSFEYAYAGDFRSKQNNWLNQTGFNYASSHTDASVSHDDDVYDESDPNSPGFEIGWSSMSSVDHKKRIFDIHSHVKSVNESELNDDHKKKWTWFFPDEVLREVDIQTYWKSYHNGWLTGRRSVLLDAPLHNLPRGQDARLLYDLIAVQKANVSILTSQLGLYVRPNGVKRRTTIEKSMAKRARLIAKGT